MYHYPNIRRGGLIGISFFFFVYSTKKKHYILISSNYGVDDVGNGNDSNDTMYPINDEKPRET